MLAYRVAFRTHTHGTWQWPLMREQFIMIWFCSLPDELVRPNAKGLAKAKGLLTGDRNVRNAFQWLFVQSFHQRSSTRDSESCWCSRISSWTLPTANYCGQFYWAAFSLVIVDLCSCHLWAVLLPRRFGLFLHVRLCVRWRPYAFCHCSCHRHVALGARRQSGGY